MIRQADPGDDRPVLTGWFMAFMGETGAAPPGGLLTTAQAWAERAIHSPALRGAGQAGQVMAGLLDAPVTLGAAP
jgi:hypothetical protein